MKQRKSCLVRIFVIASILFMAPLAHATVLTFDDIGTPPILDDGYAGFTWDNIRYKSTVDSIGEGFDNGRVSGDYIAYNPSGADASISLSSGSTDPSFNFVGAYFAAAWNDNLNITVTGLLDGTELYSETLIVGTNGPTWCELNFEGIDTLTFSSYGGTNAGGTGSGTHFSMDNFTFTAVPVPSAFLLLGMGMLSLTGMSRRKKYIK
jgi:hypothetical protein